MLYRESIGFRAYTLAGTATEFTTAEPDLGVINYILIDSYVVVYMDTLIFIHFSRTLFPYLSFDPSPKAGLNVGITPLGEVPPTAVINPVKPPEVYVVALTINSFISYFFTSFFNFLTSVSAFLNFGLVMGCF